MTAHKQTSVLRERLRPLWAGSATVGVLLLLIASAFAAQAAPIPTIASTPQTWSHSGQFWYNNSSMRNNSRFSVTYNVSAFYGYNDVITATNTSNTTTQMQGQLWENDSLIATWCVPNCTAPRYTESVMVRGWKLDSQFMNLTTDAQVYENGTAANALGITNASARGSQNVTETWMVTFGNRSYTENFSESQLAFYSVQFQPALGLIPWNLSTNLTWNATSAYNATGGWNDSYSYGVSHNGTMWGRSGSYYGAVNRTGRESVRGRDFGNATVNNNSVVQIGLRFRGPLNFDNDLFMTAIGSDLFQNATANWSVFSHPSYGMSGRALTGVYAERAAARPESTSSTNGGTSGGTTTTTGGSTSGAGTTAPGSVGSPGTTLPSPSPGTPVTVTPAPTHPASGRTGPSMMNSFAPILGLLGIAAIAGTIGAVAYRRHKSS